MSYILNWLNTKQVKEGGDKELALTWWESSLLIHFQASTLRADAFEHDPSLLCHDWDIKMAGPVAVLAFVLLKMNVFLQLQQTILFRNRFLGNWQNNLSVLLPPLAWKVLSEQCHISVTYSDELWGNSHHWSLFRCKLSRCVDQRRKGGKATDRCREWEHIMHSNPSAGTCIWITQKWKWGYWILAQLSGQLGRLSSAAILLGVVLTGQVQVVFSGLFS